MSRHSAPIVAFSGIDGAGKSTQIQQLRAHLDLSRVPHVTCWSRGGYTPGFSLAKRALRRVSGDALPPAGPGEQRARAMRKRWVRRLWLMLGIVDLGVLYGLRIRWWRRRGKWVICDRYLADTEIDFRLNFPDERVDSWWSWRMLAWLSPRPDLAFLMVIPVDESLRRSEQKHEPFPEPPDVRAARFERYQQMEAQPGWTVLDGLRPPDELSAEIIRKLEARRPRAPKLLLLNQMAGPMTWELAVDCADRLGPVALLTGHPDTLAKQPTSGMTVEPAPPHHRGSYARRVASWLAYLAKALRWTTRWPVDVPILVFSNPPFAPWLTYVLKQIQGRRYLVMVHDVYPDVLVGLGKLGETNPLVRLWRALNRRAYENAERVMTLGESMAERLRQQFDPGKTPSGEISVISPWADIDAIRPMPKERNEFARKYELTGKTTVMYSGNMGHGHDIETMLEVAKRLRHQQHLHFMLIGSGPKWQLAKRTIEASRLTNVTLLPWQPEETIPYSLSAADLAVVSLEPGIEGASIPSKAFSFFAAGVPLLLLSRPGSELGAIIEHHQCGWIVAPGATDDFIAVLTTLADRPEELEERRRNSRKVAEQLGSRANSVTLVEMLRSDLGRAARPD